MQTNLSPIITYWLQYFQRCFFCLFGDFRYNPTKERTFLTAQETNPKSVPKTRGTNIQLLFKAQTTNPTALHSLEAVSGTRILMLVKSCVLCVGPGESCCAVISVPRFFTFHATCQRSSVLPGKLCQGNCIKC